MEDLSTEPTLEELQQPINSIPVNKASGNDSIPVNNKKNILYKNLGVPGASKKYISDSPGKADFHSVNFPIGQEMA